MTSPPPRSTLFPYTTLFRSELEQAANYFNATYAGVSVGDIKRALLTEMQQASDDLSRIMQLAVRMARERSEEHTSELQSRQYLVCRLLLEKKNNTTLIHDTN